MARIRLEYPDARTIVEILDASKVVEEWPIARVASRDDVLAARRELASVYVDDNVKLYIALLVEATRKHNAVRLGASPRAAIHLMKVSQALAMIDGVDYVAPDHVKEAARYVLPHRIVLRHEAKLAGVTPDQVVEEVVSSVPAP
jgi:MoxR-like ATPase